MTIKRFMILLTLIGCSNQNETAKNRSNSKDAASSKVPEAQEQHLAQGGALVPIGFDPGLTLARAASIYPHRANYFESCPAGPGGKCHSTTADQGLPAGGGFYTVIAGQGTGVEQDCRPNSFAPYIATPQNVGVPCPYTFFWNAASTGVDAGTGSQLPAKLAPRMAVNSLAFKDSNTNNLGFGISAVIPTGSYTGISFDNDAMTPWYKNIYKISFRVRARFCNTPTRSDKFAMATFYSYISFIDPQDKSKTYTLVWNLFEALHGTPLSNPPYPTRTAIMNEAQLGGTGAVDSKNVHISAKMAGMLPAQVGYFIDQTPNCSAQLESLPWTTITLDLRETVRQMEAAGFVNSADLMKMKLTNQILAGGELYGRGLVEAEIRDYMLLGDVRQTSQPATNADAGANANAGAMPSIQQNAQLPEGHYQHTNGAKFYSNGSNASCWFVGTPPGNPALLPTSVAPVNAGLRDDGRCPWDAAQSQTQSTPAGNASNTARAPLAEGHYIYQGNNAKFYANGQDAFCWFAGNPPNGVQVVSTNVEPNTAGLRSDGRCPWDR